MAEVITRKIYKRQTGFRKQGKYWLESERSGFGFNWSKLRMR